MTALAAARKILQMDVPTEVLPSFLDIGLKAAAKPFVGGVVAVDSTGYGVAGTATTAIYCVGLLFPKAGYPQQYDATGLANGALVARVKEGVFAMKVAGSGDALAQADVFKPVFLVDDQTVGKTDGGATPRSLAGIFLGFAPNGTDAFVLISGALNALLYATKAVTGAGLVYDVLNNSSGALSLTVDCSLIAVDGTDAYTLANGLYLGQRRRCVCTAGANTPNGTFTPATPRGFASISAFGAVGDSFELEWTATGWIIVNSQGVTIA